MYFELLLFCPGISEGIVKQSASVFSRRETGVRCRREVRRSQPPGGKRENQSH